NTFLSQLYDPAIWKNVFSILALSYFIGFIAFATRWIFSWRATQQLRNTEIFKGTAELRIFTEQVAGQMNIKRKIQLYISKLAKSPMTIGFLKPIILLPIAGINHLTQEQLEAVILHELAHIKRADYLFNILQSFAELILFFNPFAHLLSKNIHLERENSCDDWVMQYQYQPALYANALLKIAKLQAAPVLALSVAGKKGQLKLRVQRLFSRSPKKPYKLLAGMIACLCLAIFLRIQFIQHNEKMVSNETTVYKTVQDDGLMDMRFSNINNKKIIAEPIKNELKKATSKKENLPQKFAPKKSSATDIAKNKLSKTLNISSKNLAKNFKPDQSINIQTQPEDNAEMNIVFASVKEMLDSMNNISSQINKSEITSLASTNPMQISRAAYTLNTADSTIDNALHQAIILITKLPAQAANEINYQVDIMGNNGKIISYTLAMKVYQ
ncbi:MAG: M56 family metallopeptidase, partial [Bacteroidota bacterium]